MSSSVAFGSSSRRLTSACHDLLFTWSRGRPALALSFAGRKPPDGPEGASPLSARSPSIPWHYCSLLIKSRNVIPIGNSYTPFRFTSPDMEYTRRLCQPLMHCDISHY